MGRGQVAWERTEKMADAWVSEVLEGLRAAQLLRPAEPRARCVALCQDTETGGFVTAASVPLARVWYQGTSRSSAASRSLSANWGDEHPLRGVFNKD